ncbi:MAG: rRNA pseudouridine synthase [Candidatus Obscuribacterales bacterium]|nr:rRNA pseudouridine synthase [Steroidobacteraceae bacterium]
MITPRRSAPRALSNRSARPGISGSSGIRLQKALADAGVAARRDCEQMIMKGRVRVNGLAVTQLPCFVDPLRDAVDLDGVGVDIKGSTPRPVAEMTQRQVYVLINKPKGVISTTRDELGRRSVLSLLPPALREEERLFPVGRLDADSTGLLMLTNDGDLAHQLTHPRFGLAKEYRVTTSGLASEEQLQKLRKGMYLITPDSTGTKNSRRANMESVRILKRFVDRSRGDWSVLSVTLREGQNREIRRMLARVGLKVRELERIAIGPLRAADLKPGQAKLLGKKDIDKLRAATTASL